MFKQIYLTQLIYNVHVRALTCPCREGAAPPPRISIAKKPIGSSRENLGHNTMCTSKDRGSGVSRISFRGGGGFKIFLEKWGYLHGEKRHAARGELSHALARGVRGHAPPGNFFKMVQFGAF